MAAQQGAGQKPGGAGKSAAGGQKSAVLTALFVILGVVGFTAVIVIGVSGDSDLSVPAPTAQERADTVAILQKAAEAQDICYGWRLQTGATVVSAGSNLGDNVPVDGDPTRCPRWVEVIADVTYTPESSELEDSARVWVAGTEGLDIYSFDSGLRRLGLDDPVFIDDPGWAITRAAVSLPLLMTETGRAPAAPVESAAPDAAPSPLPDPGPDLWRDRWGYLIAGAALLLVTVLLVGVGLAQRRQVVKRQTREEAVRGIRTSEPRAEKTKS